MGRRRIGLLAVLLVVVGLLTSVGSAGGPRKPQVRALFFGDSLIAGTGAVPQAGPGPHRHRPAGLAGVRRRPRRHRLHHGRHPTGGLTLDRLRHDGFLTTRYDVVVLEGGTNDAAHGSLTRLRAAALTTVDFVRRRQPRARIVLVGAYAPPGVAVERYAAADQILAGVAAARGLQYVSQLHYSQSDDPAFLSRDQYHPSDAGYGLMGQDLAAALSA